MKYNSSLLKKYITINDAPESIAQNLIVKTCEIEDIHQRIFHDHLVIGKVGDVRKHPEADKLNVCQVDCGKRWTFEIICGWENVQPGIYVPVALNGCYLPAVAITIAPRPMKGIVSNGMICSKEELGILEDTDKHWIWDLQTDFDDLSDKDLWIMMKEKYPRMENFVYEVENKTITNRPDLTWHFGLATELFAMYGSDSKAKKVWLNTLSKYYTTIQNTPILDTLKNSAVAKRKVVAQTEWLRSYLLLEINNVEIKDSSFFTRLLMRDVGGNPIANWVDFSNLFMLLSGQPIHFFDAAKVDGDIMVRNAKAGEKFTDLFWVEHSLLDKDIVIADKTKILALAGVVWWLESWITEQTKDILVEIANFDPVAVRKTWTRLGLRTDAELRYEKNINPVWSLTCLLLFLDELNYFKKDLWSYIIWWLASYVSAETQTMIASPKIIDLDYKIMAQTIFWREEKSMEKIATNYLEWLWFVKTGKTWWQVPCRRSPDDMNIVEDIYEEVARLYGYDTIANMSLLADINVVNYSAQVAVIRLLEDILVRNLALNQTESYPWIGGKILAMFDIDPTNLYTLKNPINPDLPYLRNDLLLGLLPHISRNSKFFDSCGIFDIGPIWHKWAAKTEWDPKYAVNSTGEEKQLGILLYQKNISNWESDPLLKAKSSIATLFAQLGLKGKLTFSSTQHKAFHPNKQADIIYEGRNFGCIGALHPLVLKEYKIGESSAVVYISLLINELAQSVSKLSPGATQYETLQDQIVWRDLCFVVDEHSAFGWLLDAVQKVKEVEAIEVFDVYKGSNLPAGKKSVALKIKIVGAVDSSMTTEQINEVMNKAIKAAEKAGGVLRS